jgi:hypothetical protein
MAQIPVRGSDAREWFEFYVAPRGYALIDDGDREWLSQWHWYFNGHYAARAQGSGRSRRTIYMHREIMGLVPYDGKHVDHINGDMMDNRRPNLRIVTHKVNMRNRRPVPGGHSRYRGVTWVASGNRSRRWMAQAGLDGRNYSLGYFATELDAAAMAAQWRAEHMPGAVEAPELLAHPVPGPPPHLGTVRYHERAAEVERLWNAGETLNVIAAALGITRNAVGSLMVRLRREGYDLPFRSPGSGPTSAHGP